MGDCFCVVVRGTGFPSQHSILRSFKAGSKDFLEPFGVSRENTGRDNTGRDNTGRDNTGRENSCWENGCEVVRDQDAEWSVLGCPDCSKDLSSVDRVVPPRDPQEAVGAILRNVLAIITSDDRDLRWRDPWVALQNGFGGDAEMDAWAGLLPGDPPKGRSADDEGTCLEDGKTPLRVPAANVLAPPTGGQRDGPPSGFPWPAEGFCCGLGRASHGKPLSYLAITRCHQLAANSKAAKFQKTRRSPKANSQRRSRPRKQRMCPNRPSDKQGRMQGTTGSVPTMVSGRAA